MSCRCQTYTGGVGNHDRPPIALRDPDADGGFTVIELILVIVIVAVLGAIAGPRFIENAMFDERIFYDELVTAMRYAQKVAIASGCPVQVSVTATTYSLTQQAPLAGHCDSADSSFPLPVLLPTGDAMSGTAPAAVTVVPALTFTYGPLGRTNLGANQILSLGSHVLTIQAESGMVVTQ